MLLAAIIAVPIIMVLLALPGITAAYITVITAMPIIMAVFIIAIIAVSLAVLIAGLISGVVPLPSVVLMRKRQA